VASCTAGTSMAQIPCRFKYPVTRQHSLFLSANANGATDRQAPSCLPAYWPAPEVLPWRACSYTMRVPPGSLLVDVDMITFDFQFKQDWTRGSSRSCELDDQWLKLKGQVGRKLYLTSVYIVPLPGEYFFKLSQNCFGVYCLYRQLLYRSILTAVEHHKWLIWNTQIVLCTWSTWKTGLFLLTSHYLSIVFSIKSISK